MITDKFLMGRRRNRLSAEALGALEDALQDVNALSARQQLVYEDALVPVSTFLIEGFMCRYVDGRNGQRQLVAIHVPGDFVDLHSYPLERIDHAVASLTEAKVAFIRHDALVGLMSRHPELVRLLWFSTMLDSAVSREWIFRLGHLPAIGRVAHFFCELVTRLHVVGMGDGRQVALPLNQADVASACGLTPEHVNRVLRQLRDGEILQFSDGTLLIQDLSKARSLGQFDAGYLYIDGVTD